MQFNPSSREVVIKVVYYGPPLSGKTTNLQSVHRVLGENHCGRLTTLDTSDDRTLFFDLLPVTGVTKSGYQLKLKLFTVPGQVIHAATRKLVLAGSDGVVFVADSQRPESRNNNEFWHGMRSYLFQNKLSPDHIPTVIQFNKRDLPDVRSESELVDIAKKGRERVFKAVAIQDQGTVETLRGLLEDMFVYLDKKHDIRKTFSLEADEFVSLLLGADAAKKTSQFEVNKA